MKTTLPEKINNIKEAQKFLTELNHNRESYHPEDDAHDIDWVAMDDDTEKPTIDQCDQLNKLMDDIYKLTGKLIDGKYEYFDPCEFLLNLDKKIN